MESARLIAGLTRLTQDIGLAEEYAQDALVTALEQWPCTGVPPNPAGWLMTTAKNRAIDAARRRATHASKLGALHRDVEVREQAAVAEADDAIDDHVGDDLLRLVFTSCRPSLTLESRIALTLRCLGGLSTAEIAAPCWPPRPPWPSASCGPSARCAASPSSCHPPPSGRNASPRCSRSCTSSSTRGTRPPPARTGRARRCAPRRCGWGGSSPACSPRSRRCTDCSP